MSRIGNRAKGRYSIRWVKEFHEAEDGFKTIWVDIDEAIKLTENSKPDTYDGPFIKIRDFTFLEKAKKYRAG